MIPREEDALPNSRLAIGELAAAAAIREGAHQISYLPTRDEIPRLPEIVDRLVEMLISTRAAWCVIVHELGDVADERAVGPALSQVIRQFSAKGWVLVFLYQRAYGLPRIITNNVDHVFLFAMNDPDDLDRAAALMGRPVRERPLGLPFRFDYYHRTPLGELLYVDQVRRVARQVRRTDSPDPSGVV